MEGGGWMVDGAGWRMEGRDDGREKAKEARLDSYQTARAAEVRGISTHCGCVTLLYFVPNRYRPNLLLALLTTILVMDIPALTGNTVGLHCQSDCLSGESPLVA